jgi:hypothetical protein
MKKPAIFPKVGTAVILAASLFIATGCGSHSVPRDLMLEEASKQPVERPVAMRGEGTFLDGKVSALATVSRGFDRGVRDGARGGRGGRGAPGTREGEGIYEDGRRRRDDVGAFTEVYNIGGYGDSEEEQKEAMEDYIRQARARRAAGSPMPPVTLRVLFENKGTEPLELEVTEVNSDLGNFAVRPPKLTIPPGEKAMLDPMISQLGVTSDEIPLKLAVRTGGKKEQQVVVVKNVIAESLRKEFEKAQK